MSIVVDPNAIKAQSASSKPKSFGVDDFSATMSAIAPGASEAMLQAQGYDSAAVTHAAITGVAGAANSYGYGSVYGGAAGLVGAATHEAGHVDGYPIPGFPNTPGVPGGTPAPSPLYTGGVPSPSYLEGSALIQLGNDSNMKMLILQTQVQAMNLQYTTLSNVLQTKFQTEKNAVSNMRT